MPVSAVLADNEVRLLWAFVCLHRVLCWAGLGWAGRQQGTLPRVLCPRASSVDVCSTELRMLFCRDPGRSEKGRRMPYTTCRPAHLIVACLPALSPRRAAVPAPAPAPPQIMLTIDGSCFCNPCLSDRSC